MRIEIGMRADGRDQLRGEGAPVAEVCWKRGPDFASPELEQSVPRATSERAFEPAGERGRQLEGVLRHREQQVAARGQRQRRHEDGSARSVMARAIADRSRSRARHPRRNLSS